MIDTLDDFEQQNQFNRRMNQWAQLSDYMLRVHELINDQAAPVDDGGGHKNRGTKPGSRAPWNQAAANLYFDIHAEIRRIESFLTITLNHRAIYRGGSDSETAKIFERLPILLRALFERDHESVVLDECLTSLISLTRRSHAALHPEERRTQAPWISCHVCDGKLWLYVEGHEVNPKLDSEHFQPGDAYCNRCAVFYPQDIWQRVALENSRVA